MNTTAVLLGLFYGIISIAICYLISMVTSGLFSRPFYRLYARVLIGVCSIMLTAPGLRWMAGNDPQMAVIGLTLVQYAVMGVLGYGVFRFNRDYMKKVFLQRSATAYFTFGTLANAAVVTLAFLHIAVTGSESWNESATGYVAAGNYGPLIVLLSAMILHTDYSLKNSIGDLRRFSRFTFLGYAVSFLGIAVSIAPHVGMALGQLELVAIDSPLLQSFFSAQTLLIAIVVYAWMVWRYESIPPLFLMLLAIVGEYHILVTQWFLNAFGPSAWGLASLPLFAGMMALDHYFANWDRRKQVSVNRPVPEIPEPETPKPETPEFEELRFAMPFRTVIIGLAIALFGVTLWTRLSVATVGSHTWLAFTFSVYAVFFFAYAFVRRRPKLAYVSGSLVTLAAFLGTQEVGGAWSTAVAGVLAVGWVAVALLGSRSRLRLEWRTPLCDIGLLTAIVVTATAGSRHFLGAHPYHFQGVGTLDSVSLLCASVAFLLSAFLYRSWLPVFAALGALATTIPPWNAALGLAAATTAMLLKGRYKNENVHALDDRQKLFGSVALPMSDVFPSLYVRPLSLGAIPLALIGFFSSATHVLQGNFSATVLAGAVISAFALMLLTLNCRMKWLYLVSLFAIYFAIHAIYHGIVLGVWPRDQVIAGHLLLVSFISVVGWAIAVLYGEWCSALLRRVAEDEEQGVRERQDYYAGLLCSFTSVAAVLTLFLTVAAVWSGNGSPLVLMVAALMTLILMVHATLVYRSQVWAYLSLATGSMALLAAGQAFHVSHWDVAVAIVGLAAAGFSFGTARTKGTSAKKTPEHWIKPIPLLQANGIDLWSTPVTLYAIACCLFAVLGTQGSNLFPAIADRLSGAASLTYALSGVAFVLCTRVFRAPVLYVAGITLAFAAAHSAVLPSMDLFVAEGQIRISVCLLSGFLSLMACIVATLIAGWIHKFELRVEEDHAASLCKIREFYCGILVHFAFLVSVLVLAGLAYTVILDDQSSSNAVAMSTGVGLLLTVTFAFMSLIYRSRIQTYFSLSALCFFLHGIATVLSPDLLSGEYQTLVLSISAVAFGLIALLAMPKSSPGEIGGLVAKRRAYDCWTSPPFPMVSHDSCLWAMPLAHVSVGLTSVALLMVGIRVVDNFPNLQPWLSVAPLFASAIAFLIATKTSLVDWSSVMTGKTDEQSRQQADMAEHSLLYVLSLVTTGVALHLTLHLVMLQDIALRASAAWHLLFASILILAGWSVATVYTLACQRRIENRDSALDEMPMQNMKLYAGGLQYVSFTAALAVFSIAGLLGFGLLSMTVPMLCCLAVLGTYFFLASFTFRSQFLGYMALASAGAALAMAKVEAIDRFHLPGESIFVVPEIAFFSFGLACLATLLAARSPGSAERVVSAPSPWSIPPATVNALWLDPIRNASFLFAAGGIMLTIAGESFNIGIRQNSAPALVTCLCFAATLVVLARLYKSPVLTYVAVALVAFSAWPFIELFGQPTAYLGVCLAVLATAFWFIGFSIEKLVSRHSPSLVQSGSSSWIRVYERPLIRSSMSLAAVGVGYGLLVWRLEGWPVCQMPLVIASAMGATTLLLNARSLSVVEGVAWARALVYLACIFLTGCWLAAYSMTWDALRGLGPNSAVCAFVLCAVGLLIVEKARAVAVSSPQKAASRLTFGEPISHFGSVLSILAILLAGMAFFRTLGLGVDVDSTRVSIGNLSSFLPLGVTLLLSAATCLLSVRAQQHIAWLYATVVFGTSGLLCVLVSQTDWPLGTLAIGSLLIMNGCASLALMIKMREKRVQAVLGGMQSRCDRPFYEWPVLVCSLLLLGQCYLLGAMVSGVISEVDWPWLWVNSLCMLLFIQVLYATRRTVYFHAIVGCSVIGLAGIGVSSDWPISPDVAIAMLGIFWGIVASLLRLRIGKRITSWLRLPLGSKQLKLGESTLIRWSIGLIVCSLIVTIPVTLWFGPDGPNVMVVLMIATLAALGGGIRWGHVAGVTTSAVLFPLCLVSASLFYGYQQWLLTYGGLIAAFIAAIYLGTAHLIDRVRDPQPQSEAGEVSFVAGTIDSLSRLSQMLTGVVVFNAMHSIIQVNDATPTALSLGVVSLCWFFVAFKSKDETLAYGAVIGCFATTAYACSAVLQIPIMSNALTAFFVVAYSFILYMVNVIVSRPGHENWRVFLRPSYYVALALPVLLVVTLPFDQPGVAAFALLAAGSFYLTVTHQSKTRWTIYVAAFLLNAAIYMWVPTARQFTGLYQLYVIPAAITVLIFAHLHRRDLKPQVLTSIRFASCGAILAVSTFEVFFTTEPSLIQFVAVLMLSLAGTALGIAMRIKPFVYTGIAFLVLNVVGQLGLRFHQEGGIIRAVILIGVGLLVLGMMIFFNIHRERILQQYRGFLADKHWQ